jgi:hypothetical protein
VYWEGYLAMWMKLYGWHCWTLTNMYSGSCNHQEHWARVKWVQACVPLRDRGSSSGGVGLSPNKKSELFLGLVNGFWPAGQRPRWLFNSLECRASVGIILINIPANSANRIPHSLCRSGNSFLCVWLGT